MIREAYLYKITNMLNGVSYIGVTVDPKKDSMRTEGLLKYYKSAKD